MINVGLAGFGYWGPNLFRNLRQNTGFNVSWILEPDKNKSAIIKSEGVKHISSNSLGQKEYDEIDALVIATPPPLHYMQIKEALLQNKHLLVSKPVVTSSNQVDELLEISNNRKLIFESDLTYLFSEKVEKLKKIFESNEYGNLIYIDSQRINLGIFQEHTNVVWDLLPHDLSIFSYLFNKNPKEIKIKQIFAFGLKTSSTSYVELTIENIPINIHLSWASPVKVRKMLFVFEKALILYNDLDSYEPIKIYKFQKLLNKLDKKSFLTSNVIGDIEIPNIKNIEPLSLLIESFRDSIKNGSLKKNSVINIRENIKLIEEGLL